MKTSPVTIQNNGYISESDSLNRRICNNTIYIIIRNGISIVLWNREVRFRLFGSDRSDLVGAGSHVFAGL